MALFSKGDRFKWRFSKIGGFQRTENSISQNTTTTTTTQKRLNCFFRYRGTCNSCNVGIHKLMYVNLGVTDSTNVSFQTRSMLHVRPQLNVGT